MTQTYNCSICKQKGYYDIKDSLCYTVNARPAKDTWQNYPKKPQRK